MVFLVGFYIVRGRNVRGEVGFFCEGVEGRRGESFVNSFVFGEVNNWLDVLGIICVVIRIYVSY